MIKSVKMLFADMQVKIIAILSLVCFFIVYLYLGAIEKTGKLKSEIDSLESQLVLFQNNLEQREKEHAIEIKKQSERNELILKQIKGVRKYVKNEPCFDTVIPFNPDRLHKQ